MKKYAMTVGVFDCLHEGHVNLFKRMREVAERVVVIVHDDRSTFENKGRFPVQRLGHRVENLQACGLVDEVRTVSSADPSTAIALVLALVEEDKKKAEDCLFVRGDDWKDFPGKKVVEDMGIEIEFVPYTQGVSTSQIRNDIQS
jgi:glycerol-3-phosphate cytidylyltransferase